jgi:prepilin-type N-terminal cleavage/methylation domain-containing protein
MRFRLIRRRGFTLVEIMIVVAIIGILAAIAIPNFMKSRETSQDKACINNLRQIDAAKQQWALENRRTGDAVPEETDLQPYLVRGNSGRMPFCPAGGATATNFTTSYSINAVTNPPACLFVPSVHVLR